LRVQFVILKKSHGHDTKGWVVVVPYSRFVKA
jgi:hypothetical protein